MLCRAVMEQRLPLSNGYLLLSALSNVLTVNGKPLLFGEETLRPACSGLMPLAFWEGDRNRIYPQTLEVRRNEVFAAWISFLDENLFYTFANGVMGKTLTVGGAGFDILSITMPGENVFSKCISLEMLKGASSYDGVHIEFVTPTGFKHNGLQYTLPDPCVFFPSIAMRLKSFTQEEFILSCCDKIETEKFTLRSRAVSLKAGAVFRGCVGNVSYSFKRCSEDEKYLLTMLSMFSFFSGAGYKTSQGMGRVLPSFG